MATFTALAKIYSTEYFCKAKVARLGKISVQQKFRLYGTWACTIAILIYVERLFLAPQMSVRIAVASAFQSHSLLS